MKYLFGDFSFIHDKLLRETLEYDLNVINNTPGAWEALSNHEEYRSFIYNKDIFDKTSNQMYSRKTLEYIAKYGWNEFVNLLNK